ncbi:winged helix-turn-helix transcriptional regulator [Listeria booriae]|uniref:Winged helix-turn-helix transcriptional regulator n=1 Tax=Listeria booriae TaxID=1552123 RepID=A0A842F882_9LIST|nr:winged helix-turn-helix transcriptional regulator [Listeria booriae]MBC2025499.1 winged helix-turn-helix transcriptional regulator [Listeria booriae]MBC2168365.1 winged helix-turn-helix transcriptional regulator [Listeria booriae]MBC2240889.1 winged helix-turn-helix transcriptional regulator [Listeria booriae]MBC2243489.1 winged helix-turn-helix transcriptional regulator [Listeria booriae]
MTWDCLLDIVVFNTVVIKTIFDKLNYTLLPNSCQLNCFRLNCLGDVKEGRPVILGENELSEKIYTLSLLQQDYISKRLKGIHLNVLQAKSLNYVSVNSGTIQKDLANYLGKQNATVTNILKELEKKQLIYREIPKDNERQKKIFLTSGGEQLVGEVQQAFADLNREMEQIISAKEKAQIVAGLEKLIADFK